MVVYVGNFDGTSKKGNDFHIVTLADISIDKDDDGVLHVSARSKEFFTRGKLDGLEDFTFGDVVDPRFELSDNLGAPPDLVALRKVEDSPFDFGKYLKEA